MLKLPEREFKIVPAVRTEVPLMLMLLGESGSGKTWSAFELATGIQEIYGGDIYGIDTERSATGMLFYEDFFKFKHCPLPPPHGPLHYQKAIVDCLKQGARIIIIDSMSHEHDGVGGVLDQIQDVIQAKGRTHSGSAQIEPKAQRKQLNRFILEQADVVFILCYRAHDKVKPVKGDEWKKLGTQPVTTSPLRFDATARFLMNPVSPGKPILQPEEKPEQVWTNIPKQFQGWVKEDQYLDRALGRRMAEWAKGKHALTPKVNGAAGSQLSSNEGSASNHTAAPSPYDHCKEMIPKAENIGELHAVWTFYNKSLSKFTAEQKKEIEALKNEKKKEIELKAEVAF